MKFGKSKLEKPRIIILKSLNFCGVSATSPGLAKTGRFLKFFKGRESQISLFLGHGESLLNCWSISVTRPRFAIFGQRHGLYSTMLKVRGWGVEVPTKNGTFVERPLMENSSHSYRSSRDNIVFSLTTFIHYS